MFIGRRDREPWRLTVRDRVGGEGVLLGLSCGTRVPGVGRVSEPRLPETE